MMSAQITSSTEPESSCITLSTGNTRTSKQRNFHHTKQQNQPLLLKGGDLAARRILPFLDRETIVDVMAAVVSSSSPISFEQQQQQQQQFHFTEYYCAHHGTLLKCGLNIVGSDDSVGNDNEEEEEETDGGTNRRNGMDENDTTAGIINEEGGGEEEEANGSSQVNHQEEVVKEDVVVDDVLECEDCLHEEFGRIRCPKCNEFTEREEIETYRCKRCNRTHCEDCFDTNLQPAHPGWCDGDDCGNYFCGDCAGEEEWHCIICDVKRLYCSRCIDVGAVFCGSCSKMVGCDMNCVRQNNTEECWTCQECQCTFCFDCKVSYLCYVGSGSSSSSPERFCYECKPTFSF